ncbi:Os01g0309966, partial [Oryza sativa Japonica Group]
MCLSYYVSHESTQGRIWCIHHAGLYGQALKSVSICSSIRTSSGENPANSRKTGNGFLEKRKQRSINRLRTISSSIISGPFSSMQLFPAYTLATCKFP